MDPPAWNQDGPYVTTPSIMVADALAMSLEKVRLHAQRMEQAMVRERYTRRMIEAIRMSLSLLLSHCHALQEKEDVRLVLKAASDMLAELSTGHNPKNYSNLYAEVFTHLQQLPVRTALCSCRVSFLCKTSQTSRAQPSFRFCSSSFKTTSLKDTTHMIACTVSRSMQGMFYLGCI